MIIVGERFKRNKVLVPEISRSAPDMEKALVELVLMHQAS
jgi:cobalamin-dependent methionine synthase I